MNRKDFMKGVGLASLGLTIPGVVRSENQATQNAMADCTLIPSETAGPFPLDLTENTTFLRQDVRETENGVELKLKLKIVGTQNCEPMPNVRVNIWHCNKDGLYSGYDVSNNSGQAGKTYLRGYQFTDANGEVEFTTIFPGWYNGRICHIHFQVYVSSSYSAVSQLTFDLEKKNALYTANSSIYTKGEDPLSYSGDNIFSDGYQYQIATLEETSSGYESYLEVAVQGTGTVGIGHLEKQTAKVVDLGQNFPNPYTDKTTIPFTLQTEAKVAIDLYDLNGRKVLNLLNENRSSGSHEVEFKPKEHGLAAAGYLYQITATTNDGAFKTVKMMTSTRN